MAPWRGCARSSSAASPRGGHQRLRRRRQAPRASCSLALTASHPAQEPVRWRAYVPPGRQWGRIDGTTDGLDSWSRHHGRPASRTGSDWRSRWVCGTQNLIRKMRFRQGCSAYRRLGRGEISSCVLRPASCVSKELPHIRGPRSVKESFYFGIIPHRCNGSSSSIEDAGRRTQDEFLFRTKRLAYARSQRGKGSQRGRRFLSKQRR